MTLGASRVTFREQGKTGLAFAAHLNTFVKRFAEELLPSDLNVERPKVNGVRAAYESFQDHQEEGKGPWFDSLVDQAFRLYSIDYQNHVGRFLGYDPDAGKGVDIYRANADGVHYISTERFKKTLSARRLGDPTVLYGRINLDHDADCEFGPFRPPERPTLTPFKVLSLDGK